MYQEGTDNRKQARLREAEGPDPPPLVSDDKRTSSSTSTTGSSRRYIVVQQGRSTAVQPSVQESPPSSGHVATASQVIQHAQTQVPFAFQPQEQYIQVTGFGHGPVLVPNPYRANGQPLFQPSVHQLTSSNMQTHTPTRISPRLSTTYSPAPSDKAEYSINRIDSTPSAKHVGETPCLDFKRQLNETSLNSTSLTLVQRASLLKHRRSVTSSAASAGLGKRASRAFSEEDSVDLQVHTPNTNSCVERSSLEKLLLSDSSIKEQDVLKLTFEEQPNLLKFNHFFQDSSKSSHLRMRVLTSEGAERVLPTWLEVTRKASYVDPSFGPIAVARIIVSSNGICKLQLTFPYLKTVYTKFMPATQAKADELLADLSPKHVLCPGLFDCHEDLAVLGGHPPGLRTVETPYLRRFDHERCAIWHVPTPSSSFSESGLIIRSMCGHCKGLYATVVKTASYAHKHNLVSRPETSSRNDVPFPHLKATTTDSSNFTVGTSFAVGEGMFV